VRRQDAAEYAGKRVYFVSLFFACYCEHWEGVRQGEKVTESKDNTVEEIPSSPLWTHGQARG
jgi:hypothetical protein